MVRRYGIFLILALYAALAAGAQTGRQAALLQAPLRPGTVDALLEDILGTELTAALRDSQITVLPLKLALPRGEDRPSLPEEERISRLLAGVDAPGADVLAAAFYLVEGQELTIQFVLYDPDVKVVLGGVLTRARKGLTVFSSAAEAVADFRPAIERYVAGGYRVEPPSGLVERIVITGPQEGSRIILVDRDAGRISGGRLVVPYSQYQIGDRIPVRTTKDGYHEASGTYELDGAQTELSLPPLYRETRMDASLRWSFGFATGAGMGARFHLVPDTLFLGLEAYRSFQADTLGASTVRHYDFNVHAGRYVVFSYSSAFRVHVSLGLGMIVTDVKGLEGREYSDLYVLMGDPTAELRLGPVTLFARPDLHYALGLGYNLLGRTWIKTPFGLPPVTLGARLAW